MEREEELERSLEHLPWAGMASVVLFFLYDGLRKYEKDPSKPFSRAFAYVSLGYVFFQIAHVFTRAKYPRFSMLFPIISLLCVLAAIFIVNVAIYFT